VSNILTLIFDYFVEGRGRGFINIPCGISQQDFVDI
jgi:hypothetical protein